MNSMRFRDCIEVCMSCATACQYCATECLKEEDVKLMSLCIAINRECALVCTATAQLLAIGSENATALCKLCAEICEACANECGKFQQMKHCRDCTKECLTCYEECRGMIERELV
jgi:hypothetical protein